MSLSNSIHDKHTKLIASSHVIQAAKALIELDELQANAVAARMELDLRIGAAFTRLQTLQLQSYTSHLSDQPISYGMQHTFLINTSKPL